MSGLCSWSWDGAFPKVGHVPRECEARDAKSKDKAAPEHTNLAIRQQMPATIPSCFYCLIRALLLRTLRTCRWHTLANLRVMRLSNNGFSGWCTLATAALPGQKTGERGVGTARHASKLVQQLLLPCLPVQRQQGA